MTERVPQRSCIALDLLRGLAALEVMIGHVRGSTWVDFGSLPASQHNPLVAIFFALSRPAYEAVLVFFVLSGALVGGQIIARVRQRRFSPADYALDRTTRIYLPLIPACLLTMGVNWLFFAMPVSFGGLLGTMLGVGGVLIPGVPGNAPLWSLNYEIWFYIIGGALAQIFTTSRSIAAFAVVLVSACIFTVLDPKFLLFWMMGAIATLVLDLPHKKTVFVIAFALAAAGIASSQLAFSSNNFPHASLIPRHIAEVMICAGICMMLPLMYSAQANAALRAIARPAAFVSGISYTLYLVHYPVLRAVDLFIPQADRLSAVSAGHFLLRIAICTATALIFYAVFERQTPALRRWLRSSFVGAGLKIRTAD